MRLRAGFMGISQDSKTLTLRPQLAWQVLRPKVSAGERTALDFLGSFQELEVEQICAIKNDFVFDPKTGRVSVKKNAESDTINLGFWQRALPLMGNLQHVDLGALLMFNDTDYDKNSRLSYCKILCAVPAVKSVSIPKDLDAECLNVLKERKDWELKTN